MSWEDLEALYWRFDAMHKGYGEWSGRPTSERDAFKRTVKQALAEKDREIANLQTCQCEGCDESLEGEAYCQSCWMKLGAAHRTLMGKAIEFAQYLDTAFWPGNNAVEKAQEFLTSPEVQAWREQEGGHEK